MPFLLSILCNCSKTYDKIGLKLSIFRRYIYNVCCFARLYITKQPQHPTPPVQASAPHAHTHIYAYI